MNRIRLLDPSVSELIAAGEVIERPASIVKELLENAIDASATAITIEIKNGGISFLRMTDNGIGFEAEDVPTAFLRHATSKVRDEQDLDHIATLGFRGEALASISAVARVELMSKTADALMGTRIVISGGNTESMEEVGCPVGTTLVVRDLFYNVPARLKFLKKDTVEGNAVQSMVEKIALSHPQISFKMIKDNKLVLHSPGGGVLLNAIHAILGKDFADSLMELSYEHQGIRVSGYVTKPAKCRNNRTMQHFFVNDRYVKSRTALVAMEEAYTHAIMVGKFPGCVLKLELGYHEVDVNVHPAKIEVRFVREKQVFEAIYFAVKTALSKADILKTDVNAEKTFVSRSIFPVENKEEPQLGFSAHGEPAPQTKFSTIRAEEYRQVLSSEKSKKKPVYPVSSSPAPAITFHSPDAEFPEKPLQHVPGEEKPDTIKPKTEDPFQFLDATSFQKKEPAAELAAAAPVKAFPEEEEELPPVRIAMIGELFKTYILFEANDVFVMIDKHAAHERILFEQLRQSVDLRESQVLLVPKDIGLSIEEREVLEEFSEVFASFGFRFSFHKQEVQILEAPLVLHRYDLTDIVEDIATGILQHKVDLAPAKLDDLLHSIACRAAVKANADNTVEELQALVEQVYLDSRIRHCPHGRPVGITMSKYEVEKKFGRH